MTRDFSQIRETLPKLVRDSVPDHIVSDNLVPIWHFANEDEYVEFLKRKLIEEVNELLEPSHFDEFMKGDYSELGDVLDVLDCMLRLRNSEIHVGHVSVAAARKLKCNSKGSFTKRIILEDFIDRSELK